MKSRRIALIVALMAATTAGGWYWVRYVAAGGEMTRTAQAFLESLSAEQRSAAALAFDASSRLEWHFIPKAERKGLQIKHMDEKQRKAAHALLSAALSEAGYSAATQIMELEGILRELEKARAGGNIRDPERYYFTLFGTPRADSKWGLSVEGHHLSLNFVVSDGKVVSSSPAFFGANPAEVKSAAGTQVSPGTRVLAKEEDLAFKLYNSLDDEQRQAALIAEKAFPEIRDAGTPQPPAAPPEGLPASKLKDDQQKLLWSLIEVYAAKMPEDVAAARLSAAREAGIERIHFAWAGAAKPSIGHYYRVQGPTFLIEFVNVQPDAAGNLANHIHSVWRDMRGDFAIQASE